jgi:hypothetical protein
LVFAGASSGRSAKTRKNRLSKKMIFAPIPARSVVELCILQGIFLQLRFNIKTEILIAKKKINLRTIF